METGANDVLVVSGGEKEILIPFVDPWVTAVDLEEREITVVWGRDF